MSRRIQHLAAILAGLALWSVAGAASAAITCATPGALGTSRVLRIPTQGGAEYGTFRYGPLPLKAKEVVLTFDDGPVAATTPKILAALKSQCVRATFFMIGKRVDADPALARQVQADGHVIGSHSWAHVPMSTLSPADQIADFDRGLASNQQATGKPTRLYRFPEFKHTPELLAYAERKNIAVIAADISSEDWRGQAAEVTLARVLERLDARGSGIILFHDNQAHTVEVIPRFLEALKARGYKVVQLAPAL
ncbi:polysaccharide deacetylase family protein [Caulobacter sp. Root655]|uniref:polysaccharide deacetylase family protein n=1 Tax=Caulobacter sp. Root655 TaxID=1736578 RepID=UPI0009E767CD|nr:polysaccharide deacetylase family protein [Caulobacter sp. Root655]